MLWDESLRKHAHYSQPNRTEDRYFQTWLLAQRCIGQLTNSRVVDHAWCKKESIREVKSGFCCCFG